MTSATTADAPASPRRRAAPRAGGLLLASLAIHAVLLAAVWPLARSVMAFDPAEEQRRTAAIREREKLLEEHLRQRELTPEQARHVEQREATRRRDEMRQRVRELARDRERMIELRQRAFEQLAQRRREDVQRQKLAPLQRELQALDRQMEKVAAAKDADPAKVQDVRKLQQAMREELAKPPTPEHDPAQTLERVEEAATAAAAKLGQIQREGQNSSLHHEARLARDAAAKIAALAAEAGKPPDMDRLNSTAGANRIDPPPAAAASDAGDDPAALYDAARRLEDQVARAHADARAAELAMSRGSGFDEARAMLNVFEPDRPDLSPALRGGDAGGPTTAAEAQRRRDTLREASEQVGDMARRAGGMVDAFAQLHERHAGPGGRFLRQALANHLARGGRRGPATGEAQGFGLAGGDGGDSTGMRADWSGEGMSSHSPSERREALRLPESAIHANALPGRMFTDASDRRGWLYIDTWYVIGPWDNAGRGHWDVTHPPEYEVDFDAAYLDGKFADQPGHPDHVLAWRFVQSDHIRVQPPRTYGGSTYYAYTEVYSDRDRVVLIAVASDDAARVWLNDEVVWEDTGDSAWRMGEGFREVRLARGTNPLLVRIENGPGECIWSVLLCPPEAVGSAP